MADNNQKQGKKYSSTGKKGCYQRYAAENRLAINKKKRAAREAAKQRRKMNKYVKTPRGAARALRRIGLQG